ncbi:MAG: hypothetical protein R3D35_10850 [Nitratireductor sp.]
MTKRPKNYEPPLHLDMDFDEALRRFAQTDKKEADELSERTRKKKKAGKVKDPPGKVVNRKSDSG